MFLKRAVVRGRTLSIQTMCVASNPGTVDLPFGLEHVAPRYRVSLRAVLSLSNTAAPINPRKRIRSDDETNLGSGPPRVMGSITPL
jgi:hypothetical protein